MFPPLRWRSERGKYGVLLKSGKVKLGVERRGKKDEKKVQKIFGFLLQDRDECAIIWHRLEKGKEQVKKGNGNEHCSEERRRST